MRPAADTRINISKDDHCVSAVDTIDNASLVLDEIAEQKERLALVPLVPSLCSPLPSCTFPIKTDNIARLEIQLRKFEMQTANLPLREAFINFKGIFSFDSHISQFETNCTVLRCQKGDSKIEEKN